MRTLFIALFLISGLFQSVCGQKVKYKDLFPMLDAARYEEAEPFLRQFLVQEPDHANAALQMGLLLENKARETDILKAYERIQELTDSAVIYYSKFNSMVSEKELKKNDEYYQSYNRRDLRTGKFEIKLEDVKYDVDDKVEELNKYSATVGEANEQMENAIRQYQTAKSSFIYLSRSVLIKYISAEIIQCNPGVSVYMSVHYDSSMVTLKEIQETLKELDNEEYLRSINIQRIEDYKADGYDEVDFLQESVSLWDYKLWGEGVNQEIEERINPFRASIIAYGEELNQKLENQDLEGMLAMNQDYLNVLEEMDSVMLPEQLMEIKRLELQYLVNLDSTRNPYLQDSTHIDHLLYTFRKGDTLVTKADSIIAGLPEGDLLKAEVGKHVEFVTNIYGSQEKLEEYLEEKQKWMDHEHLSMLSVITELESKAALAIYEEDSIQMKDPMEVVMPSAEAGFYVTSLTDTDSLMFIAGYSKIDSTSIMGFIAEVPPSRRVNWYYETDLSAFLVKNDSVDHALEFRTLYEMDTASNIHWTLYYRLRDSMADQAHLAAIDEKGKKLWEVSIQLDEKPNALLTNGEDQFVRVVGESGSEVKVSSKGIVPN